MSVDKVTHLTRFFKHKNRIQTHTLLLCCSQQTFLAESPTEMLRICHRESMPIRFESTREEQENYIYTPEQQRKTWKETKSQTHGESRSTRYTFEYKLDRDLRGNLKPALVIITIIEYLVCTYSRTTRFSFFHCSEDLGQFVFMVKKFRRPRPQTPELWMATMSKTAMPRIRRIISCFRYFGCHSFRPAAQHVFNGFVATPYSKAPKCKSRSLVRIVANKTVDYGFIKSGRSLRNACA